MNRLHVKMYELGVNDEEDITDMYKCQDVDPWGESENYMLQKLMAGKDLGRDVRG